MADVKDANATPDTVSVSLHDTPDGDDLASAQLDSAGAEGDKSRSGDADVISITPSTEKSEIKQWSSMLVRE